MEIILERVAFSLLSMSGISISSVIRRKRHLFPILKIVKSKFLLFFIIIFSTCYEIIVRLFWVDLFRFLGDDARRVQDKK